MYTNQYNKKKLIYSFARCFHTGFHIIFFCEIRNFFFKMYTQTTALRVEITTKKLYTIYCLYTKHYNTFSTNIV